MMGSSVELAGSQLRFDSAGFLVLQGIIPPEAGALAFPLPGFGIKHADPPERRASTMIK